MFMVKIWSHSRLLAGGLKDQLLAVGRKVCFGVLSSEGELANVAQMVLLRRGEIRVAL